MFSFKTKKRIYLDHAATTPLDAQVLRAMNDVYENHYFNPGGLYNESVVTAQKVSDARKSVAKLLGTTSDHIVFTRGGTESVNMGVFGVIKNYIQEKQTHPQPPLIEGAAPLPHVIVSEIEHAAVLESVKDLELQKAITLSIAPVTAEGIVDMDELKKLLRPETILVSVMYVNNEIGTIQPIREIAKLLRWHRKQVVRILPLLRGGARRAEGSYPLFHCDAIQAANYLDINVERLGVDLMSLSGSKIYGPKSSGVLYVRNRDFVAPILHGGEQEFGLRAGTEDIAQIVGFAKALEIARAKSESEFARLSELQNYFFAELEKNISGVKINGAWRESSPSQGEVPERSEGGGVVPLSHCIPNNINISIRGISGERLIIELDAVGICASSKSACREDDGELSHVIAAIRKFKKMGNAKSEGSLRFTMGRGTSKSDISKVVLGFGKIVNKIKEFEDLLTK